jgi:hypothetical protein
MPRHLRTIDYQRPSVRARPTAGGDAPADAGAPAANHFETSLVSKVISITEEAH